MNKTFKDYKMKIAILHVTRMKINDDEHKLLTSDSKRIMEDYVDRNLSAKVENVKITNYFINTGHCWSQMREIFDEINNKKFDGFLLYLTPMAGNLKYFTKDFLDFTHTHLKKTPLSNMIVSKGYLSAFVRGIQPNLYGTVVMTSPDIANI